VGLLVDERLGYSGHHKFHTAEMALRWIRPEAEMLADEAFPAESWRIKQFEGPLYLHQVLAQASAFPPELERRYPELAERKRTRSGEASSG
jgi:hypothetical protein